jgi:hypothetical protein
MAAAAYRPDHGMWNRQEKPVSKHPHPQRPWPQGPAVRLVFCLVLSYTYPVLGERPSLETGDWWGRTVSALVSGVLRLLHRPNKCTWTWTCLWCTPPSEFRVPLSLRPSAQDRGQWDLVLAVLEAGSDSAGATSHIPHWCVFL